MVTRNGTLIAMAVALASTDCCYGGLAEECAALPSDTTLTSGRALVVGNWNYSREGLIDLSTPRHDALIVATALRKIGFEVSCLENATKDQILAAAELFVRPFTSNKPVVFYFS